MSALVTSICAAPATQLTGEPRGFLSTVKVSAESLLVATMTSLPVTAHQKGLELAYYVEPDVPPELIGAPVRLRQVLVNLAGNAIKFTEKGEVSVNVAVAESSNQQITLHFSVHDTGIGIPPENQVRLFSPFEQADSTTTRKYGGTGLGLAISLRLIQAMGGEIGLENSEGEGATFHFTARFGLPPQEQSRGFDPMRWLSYRLDSLDPELSGPDCGFEEFAPFPR